MARIFVSSMSRTKIEEALLLAWNSLDSLPNLGLADSGYASRLQAVQRRLNTIF
jgi:hypothetical protein